MRAAKGSGHLHDAREVFEQLAAKLGTELFGDAHPDAARRGLHDDGSDGHHDETHQLMLVGGYLEVVADEFVGLRGLRLQRDPEIDRSAVSTSAESVRLDNFHELPTGMSA